jgi:hypothetical protein
MTYDTDYDCQIHWPFILLYDAASVHYEETPKTNSQIKAGPLFHFYALP